MRISKLPILPLLIIVFIAASAWLLYSKIEFVDEEFDTGASKEVRDNTLFAASRLLEKNGYNIVAANDRRIFKNLPTPAHSVIWLRTLDSLLTDNEYTQLFGWVENGGHLITGIAEHPEDNTSLMSRYLANAGINWQERDVMYESQVENLIEQDALLVLLPGYDQHIDLALGYEPYLQSGDKSRLRIGTEASTSLLVQRKVGKGWLTAYTYHYAFDNWSVSYEDQAYLLLWLLQPSAGNTVHVMLEPRDLPGLMSTLWAKFPLVILTLLIVLLGFLRLAALRLGPIETEAPAGGSNLLAHLRARGEFWRRHRNIEAMLTPVRHAAISVVKRQQGDRADAAIDLGTLDDDTLFAKAADLADCSTHQARNALLSSISSDTDLVNSSVVLHRLLNNKNARR